MAGFQCFFPSSIDGRGKPDPVVPDVKYGVVGADEDVAKNPGTG